MVLKPSSFGRFGGWEPPFLEGRKTLGPHDFPMPFDAEMGCWAVFGGHLTYPPVNPKSPCLIGNFEIHF